MKYNLCVLGCDSGPKTEETFDVRDIIGHGLLKGVRILAAQGRRVHTAPSGAQFLVPMSYSLRGISESVMQICFPLVLRGNADKCIIYNPATQFCELRIAGKVVARESTLRAIERLPECPAFD
jgi:hypothetical protein